MSNSIHTLCEDDYRAQVDLDLLRRAVEIALDSMGRSGCAVSVIIDSEAKLKDLNRQFAGLDQATDVLSFPAGELDPDSGLKYLGDIFISFPHVVAQSQAAGHRNQVELWVLTVHGILHLMGYDHATDAESRVMFSLQSEIIARIRDEIDKE